MKHLLLTTIAAVLLVGCATTQQPEPTTPKAPDISIHDAAKAGDIETVKQHLAAGTDVNAKDKYGRTPLYCAARRSHKEIAELLIAKGADANAKTGVGETPMQIAYQKGHTEIVELLIANGADGNAKGDGQTPLHGAAYWGSKEIVQLLIAKGADVNAKTNNGTTPLDRATMPNSPFDTTETADLLRKHGGKTGEELKAEGK